MKINTDKLVFHTKAFGTIHASVCRTEGHAAGPGYWWQAKRTKSLL